MVVFQSLSAEILKITDNYFENTLFGLMQKKLNHPLIIINLQHQLLSIYKLFWKQQFCYVYLILKVVK